MPTKQSGYGAKSTILRPYESTCLSRYDHILCIHGRGSGINAAPSFFPNRMLHNNTQIEVQYCNSINISDPLPLPGPFVDVFGCLYSPMWTPGAPSPCVGKGPAFPGAQPSQGTALKDCLSVFRGCPPHTKKQGPWLIMVASWDDTAMVDTLVMIDSCSLLIFKIPTPIKCTIFSCSRLLGGWWIFQDSLQQEPWGWQCSSLCHWIPMSRLRDWALSYSF